MSNVVPKNWQYVKFSDHLDVRSGKGFTMSEYSESGLRLVRIDNVSWGEITWDSIAFLPLSYQERYPELILNEGDILLALNRPITQGKLKITRLTKQDLPSILYQRVGKILFKDNLVACKFAYHWLSYWLFEFLINNLVGSDQPFINISELRKIQMQLPPLPEQQKIAKILTSVDEVIEKTQAQIDKLKDLKTGMMQELLTSGIGHTEFKDSPVGRIPAEWSVLKISELCSHVVDCVNKTAPVVDFKTPYKMIRTTNVRHGRVDTENVRCVTKETFELWTRRLLPENGDLIFTREAPVGECGILKDSRGVFLGQRTMMYRANKAKTSAEFLMYSIMSDYGKQQLEDFSGGSTVGHMRVPDCGRILIKTPPLDEQAKIVKLLGSVDTSILVIEKKLTKINHSKKALMQDLLTGKVRVKVDSK